MREGWLFFYLILVMRCSFFSPSSHVSVGGFVAFTGLEKTSSCSWFCFPIVRGSSCRLVTYPTLFENFRYTCLDSNAKQFQTRERVWQDKKERKKTNTKKTGLFRGSFRPHRRYHALLDYIDLEDRSSFDFNLRFALSSHLCGCILCT